LSVPVLGVDRLDAGAGLSVTSETPVSKKDLPSVGFGFSPSFGELLDRLDAERCHHQRILLRGRADDAFGTDLTPGQPPSTETISTFFSMPTAFSAW
jgi:hypothetical protein